MRDERTLRAVIDSLGRTLEHIQDKLKQAHVLNGGFDLLMEKIAGIEEKQAIKSQQITDIHTALYDPDKGLHARLVTKADDKEVEELKSKVEGQKNQIADLLRWRSGITKIILAVALPMLGSFGKIIYDLIAAHVQLK